MSEAFPSESAVRPRERPESRPATGIAPTSLPAGITLAEPADALTLSMRPRAWTLLAGAAGLVGWVGLEAFTLVTGDRGGALFLWFWLAVSYGQVRAMVNRSEIAVRSDGIHLRQGPMPAVSPDRITAGEVEHVCRELHWIRPEGGGDPVLLYELKAILGGGRTMTLLVCPDEQTTLRLAEDIQRRLGISGPTRAERIDLVPEDASEVSLRLPHAFRRAGELLQMGQSRERVARQLAESGIGDDDVAVLIGDARREIRSRRQNEAGPALARGFLVLSGLLVFWFVSSLVSTEGLGPALWFAVVYAVKEIADGISRMAG